MKHGSKSVCVIEIALEFAVGSRVVLGVTVNAGWKCDFGIII